MKNLEKKATPLSMEAALQGFLTGAFLMGGLRGAEKLVEYGKKKLMPSKEKNKMEIEIDEEEPIEKESFDKEADLKSFFANLFNKVLSRGSLTPAIKNIGPVKDLKLDTDAKNIAKQLSEFTSNIKGNLGLFREDIAKSKTQSSTNVKKLFQSLSEGIESYRDKLSDTIKIKDKDISLGDYINGIKKDLSKMFISSSRKGPIGVSEPSWIEKHPIWGTSGLTFAGLFGANSLYDLFKDKTASLSDWFKDKGIGGLDLFGYGLGVIPGFYLTSKLLKFLEGRSQEEEYNKELEEAQNLLKKKNRIEKQSSDMILDHKRKVINAYLDGFREEFYKKADYKFVDKLMEQAKDNFYTANGIFPKETINTLTNKLEKTASIDDIVNYIKMPFTASTDVVNAMTTMLSTAPLALGLSIPLGYLIGNKLSQQYYPYEEQLEETEPTISIVKKKKKKEPKESILKDFGNILEGNISKVGSINYIEKNAVDLPLGEIPVITQMIGAGYLIDLIRKNMGEDVANNFKNYYLDKYTKQFNMADEDNKKKKGVL